jgi:hypothetical protein
VVLLCREVLKFLAEVVGELGVVTVFVHLNVDFVLQVLHGYGLFLELSQIFRLHDPS